MTELLNVVMNGADIAPLVDAELNRRMPQRALMRPDEERLASEVSGTEPGWPQVEDFPTKKCLRLVLNEEWEHRLYADRDLTALEKEN